MKRIISQIAPATGNLQLKLMMMAQVRLLYRNLLAEKLRVIFVEAFKRKNAGNFRKPILEVVVVSGR